MNAHVLDTFLFIALPYVCMFTFLLMTSVFGVALDPETVVSTLED